MYPRKQFFKKAEKNSFFLWGARQTGKSTLLKNMFPHALIFDLLKNEVYQQFMVRPEMLREIVLANPQQSTVLIDEIQKIPTLLNEVHWLIENAQRQFILSGSSPRNILRQKQNTLGGRALRYELYPLTSAEIPDIDLMRALNHGLLPRHYLSQDPWNLLSAYVSGFLENEILSEARARNLSVFMNFLYKAAFSNGEMVNYSNIASDCGVSSVTVKEYFQILQDTMLGRFLPSFQKKLKRKVVTSPKFYFFDIGIVNYLLKRKKIEPQTEVFGQALEHFIYMELHAYKHYAQKDFDITFWRTRNGLEVDFILAQGEVAIEVKSTENIMPRHTKNLRAFMEEYQPQKSIVICQEHFARLHEGILILPWRDFLTRLWAGEIL